MSEEFDHDLARCRAELQAAREGLLSIVRGLSDDDLDSGPRGQWTVRRILEHVIYSEQAYARVVKHLRGRPVEGEMPECTPSSSADAVDRLAGSRQALLASVEGVDEESFYRLTRMGPEEYSVISLLENEVNHEREHSEQIMRTVGGRG